MNRQTIHFTTREAWLENRRQDVTSSEVSALFGCNPYLTAYELWHQKAGNLADNFEETELTRWGLRLEPVIAAGVCKDYGWSGQPFTDYIRIPEIRAGSSFDWRIHDGERECPLEIKNVDEFALRHGWLVVYPDEDSPGMLEAPIRIELQLQQEMLCSGYNHIVLAALVGGNSVRIIRRDADANVQQEIIAAIREFWQSIADNRPPQPDYYRDSDAIRRLHPFIQGDALALTDEDRITELMRSHAAASKTAKASKEDADAYRNEIMHLLGNRPGAKGPAGSITRFPVAGGTVSYERKPRIDMRITHAK